MSILLKSVSNTDTTLSVSDDASLPESEGVIKIGSEIITYDENYMGTLYGCGRGARSTSATSHSVNTSISLVDFYESAVTSAVQTQLNNKAPINSPTFTGTIVTPLAPLSVVIVGGSSELTVSLTTDVELEYVHGVTSSIQDQLDDKQATLSSVTSDASIGGGTSESVNVSGLLTSSTIYAVSMETPGASPAYVSGFAVTLNGKIDLIFSADPGAGLTVRVCFI
jgi:hypothetical protein